jgi:hypothetical protein
LHVRAKCPAHHILLDLITLIFGEDRNYEFPHDALLQPPAPLSLLGPYILLCTLFSCTLNLCSSLCVRNNFHTHTKQQVKSWICKF